MGDRAVDSASLVGSTASVTGRGGQFATDHERGIAGLLAIKKHKMRRVAHRRVMSGELQSSCCAIHAKHRDIVGPLVTAIEESPRGIEREAAGIIAAGPLFAEVR